MDVAKDKQSVILEQNTPILDKFHSELKNSADKHNKIRITDFKSKSFYLPPISQVHHLLGFITHQKQFLDIFEASYHTPLNVSNTSRYAFFKQGVGLRTARKIINWLKLIPFPWKELTNKKLMAKVMRSNRAGSNAGGWFSTIIGFKVSSYGKTAEEFNLLFDFIEQRCKTEVDLLLRVKEDIKSGKLTTDDITAVWQAQQPLWENNPHLPKDIIKNLSELMILHKQGERLTEEQTLGFIESYIYLYFDFFLEAITHYEIGCRILYGTNKEKIENELGIITTAIHTYATQDNIKTCFSGMLKEFKDVLSDLVGETSFRKMASFIDINETESSEFGESLEDKQYNQLKDWRNGKNLPGGEKLTAFLENMDKYAKTESGFVTFDMCRITMAVDKLVNDILAQTKNENCNQADIEVTIKKVLANIPNYYQTNLKTELEKRKLREKSQLRIDIT